MKAWVARKKDEFCATVVFAETRGQARAIALTTDSCADADFCDIEVRRLPKADKLHKPGKIEMDWDNPKDRLFLVKDCSFQCEPYYVEFDECESCSAKEYCGLYEQKKKKRCHPCDVAYFDIAITAMKEQENIYPLTVENLQQMPIMSLVWVEILEEDFQRAESGYYKKQFDFTKGEAFCCGYPGIIYCFDYSKYWKEWIAYRHQPNDKNKNEHYDSSGTCGICDRFIPIDGYFGRCDGEGEIMRSETKCKKK